MVSFIAYGIIQDNIPPNILKPIEVYYCQNHNQFAIRKLKYIDTNLVYEKCYCDKGNVFIINKSHKDFEILNLKYQICSKIFNLKEDEIINFINWYNKNKNNQFYKMSKLIRQNVFMITSNQTIDLNNLNKENIIEYSYDITYQYPVKPEEISNGNYIGNRKDYTEYKLEKINPVDYYAMTLLKPFF
jgi:hypothetical protein